MDRAIRIATVRGIEVRIHWTFSLLIVGIVALYALSGQPTAEIVEGVVFVLALFGCVILHEFGHALTARRFGVVTRDIILYPIGGVARLERIPEEPQQEFLIAIAGPAVNVAIAVVLLAILMPSGQLEGPEVLLGMEGSLPGRLLWLNLVLAGFNMIPAFPMDGGRILRALLATRMDYVRATRIAAGLGQAIAVGFGFLGLVIFNPFLVFISLFVYLGAQHEGQAVVMRSMAHGVLVSDAMLTRFDTLAPDNTLQDAVANLIAGSDHEFPVLDEGRLVGLLTRKMLITGLSKLGADARVREAMRADWPTIERSATLQEAFGRLQETRVQALPVLDGARLVGMLTLENIGEWMMVSTALRQRAPTHPNGKVV